ncbi:TPA: UDP-N-acetylmuramate--L-alanine ligase [bacterium]|nr:UDP-N-acetylmuramate--L-alanine ligase [bacterium]
MRYHFVGLGGSGMSSLAQILRARGHEVSGSDRSYDRGVNLELFCKLASSGIPLFAQDGEGLKEGVDRVVISSAIEEDNPDLTKAYEKGIPVIRRAELLAELTNQTTSIAVAGTSGKTTTCGMIGYVLHRLGWDPTIINGGIINNFASPNFVGNALNGHSDLVVFEADESDGSVALYQPEFGVLTNIELDHRPLRELEELFITFLEGVKKTIILNAEYSSRSFSKNTITFGLKRGNISPYEVETTLKGSSFKIGGISYRLNLIGFHNLLNALAAIATLKTLGLKDEEISKALECFKGIRRRLEYLGEVKGIRIFDDYAHNPDKIRASISVLRDYFERLIIIFQPHGYQPTKFLKDRLIQTFKENLRNKDILFVGEIYYAGGTTKKDISSQDLVGPLQEEGRKVYYSSNREEIIAEVVKRVQGGDGVLVMGARDETLREFSLKIIEALSSEDTSY